MTSWHRCIQNSEHALGIVKVKGLAKMEANWWQPMIQ